MNTVSNMKKIEPPSSLKDEYEWTPPMSSYLLAFIVSKYDVKKNANAAKPFGVYARPEAISQTELALVFGEKMLAELGTYLGMDYYTSGNNKMDMAAIPDFSAGGENSRCLP
jgi:aminopeptidase N